MVKPKRTAVGILNLSESTFFKKKNNQKEIHNIKEDIWQSIRELIDSSNAEFLEAYGWEGEIEAKLLTNNILLFFKHFQQPPDAQISVISEHLNAIMSILFNEVIFFKGAVAFGECTLDEENAVYTGDAITEAEEWINKQNWFGGVICPSAEKKIDPATNYKLALYLNYHIPLKKEENKDGYALQWVKFSDIPYLEFISRTKNKIIKSSKKDPSEEAVSLLAMLENTQNFVQHVIDHEELDSFNDLLEDLDLDLDDE